MLFYNWFFQIRIQILSMFCNWLTGAGILELCFSVMFALEGKAAGGI